MSPFQIDGLRLFPFYIRIYSGRFPQVGAKFLALKNIFLLRSPLNPIPGTNPLCKTAPIISKPALNTPNCAYFTQFPLKKAN